LQAASDKLLLLPLLLLFVAAAAAAVAWVKIYENELQLLCAQTHSWDQLKFIRNLRVIYECCMCLHLCMCMCTEKKGGMAVTNEISNMHLICNFIQYSLLMQKQKLS